MKIINNTIWNSIIRYVLFIALVPLIIASILLINVSFSTTNQISHEQSSEINKQIVLNFENYINSLIDTSDYMESQIEKYDVIYDEEQLYLNFKSAIELQKDIESIDLYDKEGLLIMEETVAQQRYVGNSEWFEEAVNNKNIYNFSKISKSQLNGKEEFLALSRYVTYFERGVEKKGVVRIDINFNRIRELVNITNLGTGGGIIFINEHDEIIYSSIDFEGRYENENIADKILGEFRMDVDDNNMLVHINTITNTRWRVVTFLNRNIITSVKNKYITYFLIILIVTLFLAILIAVRFTKKVTKPIEKLKNTLLEQEPGKVNLPINNKDYGEIKVLNKSINDMSMRIDDLMNSVISEQEAKAELQLDILQHQINPHFLYNTLDTIAVLSENDKKKEVVNTIIALSKYFRINLSGGSKYISVEKELEQIENYLKIQKARYQSRFEYEIRVNPAFFGYKVLKLILQPLVENAIYHGTSAYEESKIVISHEVSDAYYFRVANSGYGLTDSQIEQIHANMKMKSKGKNVGLKNVYERIKLYYGDEADLYFEVDKDNFTIVTIKLPLKKLERVEK